MPPKHGQSQLISPVSGLKAPCWSASSARAAGSDVGVSLPSGGGAAPSDTLVESSSVAAIEGVGGADSFASFSFISFSFWRSAVRDSRV